ncbi:MAG: NF038130 family PEP-CTERM protein, partial [Cyanobacteriota bacterium]|nr:NF038130 family PEP-CTERM protein [Cyanobacteriota bacterium]
SDQIKGFQRSSDPNVSYITTSGSNLLIGLAGHYDAKAFYASTLGPLAGLIADGFQVSEVVKVNYGGVEELLYSFNATQSGSINAAGTFADGRSHTGNYEVSLTASVPEPSIVLGLMGLGGFFVARRKSRK